MKTTRRIIALALSAILVIGCCIITSYADDSIRITLKAADPGTETGETLTAYKVLDVTKKAGVNAQNDNSEALGFSYFISKDSVWLSAVQQVTQFKLTETADKTGYNVELKDGVETSDATAKAIAATLLTKKPASASGISIASGQTVTAAPGYYLIESPLGSNLILATTDIVINEKNDYPTVDKAVASSDETAEIGSLVTFTITVAVPASADNVITLTDTMSEGLTFSSIESVKAGNDNVDYTPQNADAQHQTFTIEFSRATVKANAGKNIVITYKALVNEKAKVSPVNSSEEDDNTNTVSLRYSNYTQTDKVDVNTLKFKLLKYDASDNSKKPIAGAVFQLLDSGKNPISLYEVAAGETYRIATPAEKAAGTNIVTSFTTVANKDITFNGVDSDLTYYLHETSAPDGYNKLAEDITVQPAADCSTVAEVPNNQGTELPSTGGMGTALIYIIGGVLVVGCGAMLILKKTSNK